MDESQVYTVTYEDVCEDEYTLEVEVDVAALPDPGLPSDTVACDATSLVLPNGPWPAGITGTWDDGSTDAAYTVSGAGTYTLTLEDTDSGCSTSADVDVVAVSLPNLSLGDDQINCPNEAVSFDFSGNDPNLTYAWNGIPGTDTYTTTQSGTLTLEWGLSVCSASDEVELSHHPTYNVSWEEDPIILCVDEVETAPALDPA